MTIYEAIADIMRDGCAIGKGKYNPQQNFNYRGIDDVMNTFQPLMAQRGIFIVPEVLENHREERQSRQGGNLIYSVLKVKYTFYASDGSNISAVVVGEGMDTADKASNKAMAAAMKYAMFQVFCIPTEEMKDPDGDSHPESTPTPPPPPCNCERCHKGILPYIGKDGKTVSIKKHCEGSREKFNQILCLDCIEIITAGGNNNA